MPAQPESSTAAIAPTPAQKAKPRLSTTQVDVSLSTGQKAPTYASFRDESDRDPLISLPPKDRLPAARMALERQLQLQSGHGRFTRSTGTITPQGLKEKRSSTMSTSAASRADGFTEKGTYGATTGSEQNSSKALSTFAESLDNVGRLHDSGLTGL